MSAAIKFSTQHRPINKQYLTRKQTTLAHTTYSISTSWCTQCKLIESQTFPSSLHDAGTSGLGEAQSANLQCGNLKLPDVVSDGSYQHSNLVVLHTRNRRTVTKDDFARGCQGRSWCSTAAHNVEGRRQNSLRKEQLTTQQRNPRIVVAKQYLSSHVLDKAAHGERSPVDSAHEQTFQDDAVEGSICPPHQKPVELLKEEPTVKIPRCNNIVLQYPSTL